jgi:hypothetical protein
MYYPVNIYDYIPIKASSPFLGISLGKASMRSQEHVYHEQEKQKSLVKQNEVGNAAVNINTRRVLLRGCDDGSWAR